MASSNKTIRFTIKTVTEGGEEIKELGINAKDLEEALKSTQRTADKGIKTKVDAIGLESVINMIGKLNGMLQDLTDSYKVQEQAETKLAVAMRNTMDATDAQIESIKELCSAQQELGVIGDEVQLQGAERLSTYLQTTDALEKLIPVMNDLTVKMYGMDASGENAAAAAAILGKAMMGNTTALKKYGIEFTDAQKVILEFGEESEKAALLTEVLGEKFGGMNEELAKTDSGRIKQLENTLGDLKESLGQVFIKVAPLVDVLTQIGTAGLGAATIIKGLNVTIPLFKKAVEASITSVKGLSASLKSAGLSAKFLGVSLKSALISTGIGALIVGLTVLIEKLCLATDKASDSLDKLADAEDKAARKGKTLEEVNRDAEKAARQSETALRINIQRLEEFNGTKEEEKKLVKEMNALYGDSMGYFSSVSGWYEALTKNVEKYCRQLVIKNKIEKLSNELSDWENKKEDINNNLKDENYGVSTKTEDVYENAKSGRGVVTVVKQIEVEDRTERDQALKDWLDLEGKIQQGYEELKDLTKEDLDIEYEIKGSGSPDVMDDEKEKARQARETKREEERLAKERAKAKEDADKALLALGRKNSEDYIALMDNEEMRQLAQIGKAYSDRMDEIARKEKELTDLRIKEGKSGLEESEKELFAYARELADQQFDKAYEALTPLGTSAIKTFDELTKALNYWNDKFNKANKEERAEIQKTIYALEDLKDSFDLDKTLSSQFKDLDKLKSFDSTQFKIEIETVGMEGWISKMREMQKIMGDTSATDQQKESARKLYEEYRELAKQSVSYTDTMISGWNEIKGLAGSIENLTDVLNGQKNAWESIVTVVDSAISIYQGVMLVMEMMNTLSEIFGAKKTAEAGIEEGAAVAKATSASENATASAVTVAANEAETQSFVKLAAAQYLAAHASIPFAGFGIGSGFVASMEALMATLNIPMFADGGIVSGPTLGIMGEYAGASSNPEVIAPLDKLQSMLGETGPGTVRVVGESKISGKDLVIVFRNTTSIASKSGRKTGIKL